MPTGAAGKDSMTKDGLTVLYAGNGGNCSGCEWISIDGRISPSAPDTFLQFLRQMDMTDSHIDIYLNSGGGNLQAAMELGRTLRRLKLATYVGRSVEIRGKYYSEIKNGSCVSACAYSFIGGIKRRAEKGTVGVHRFYDPRSVGRSQERIFSADDFSEQQKLSAAVLEYVTEMGVAPDFVITADRIPSTSIYYFSDDEMRRLRVNYDPATLTDWALKEKNGGIIMSSKSGDGSKEISLSCDADGKMSLEARYNGLTAEKVETFKNTFVTSFEAFDFLSIKIPKWTTRLNVGKDFAVLSASINDRDVGNLLAAKGDGWFEIPDPRVIQGVFLIDLETSDFGPNVSLTRRNCLPTRSGG
jgi:hypothetical protein